MNFLNGACMTIVATLVIGCDDTPVGSSSSRSIVGNWGSTIVQESATNTATMDVEFGFNDDLSMTTKLLLK